MPPKSPARAGVTVLAAGLLALALLVLAPAGRAFLATHVLPPLAAQADGTPHAGYSVPGLAFWGLVGAWLASVAWLLVIRGLRVPVDERLWLTLAPFLAWGPLAHALLQADALGRGTVLAWAAAEPLVYATTAVLATLAFTAGALAGRFRDDAYAWPPAVAVGALALAALAPATARALADGGRPWAALALAAGAVLVAVLVGALARALAHAAPVARAVGRPAGVAVVTAHAIDGLSTWAVLRDPFGLGFRGFAEKNPVANTLVEIGNGWPFPVAKLVLSVTLVILVWQGTDRPEDRALRTPALLALFVLGWGPGVANLLLVAFGA